MNTESKNQQWLQEVESYYDETNDLWSHHMGSTIQAGILTSGSDPVDILAHNVFLAHRAGIRPGDYVLDAGCGICGPAIDIASSFDGVSIEAITISNQQVFTARERVAKCGLQDRVRVHQGDYHELPFENNVFDVVQFLESSAHAHDPATLFQECYRVLRPGGILFLKDGFVSEEPTAQQKLNSLQMDQRFHMQTRKLSDTVLTIRDAGFEILRVSEITNSVNANYFMSAMLRDPALPNGPLTPLGQYHYQGGEWIMDFNWPVIAEIKAIRPIQ